MVWVRTDERLHSEPEFVEAGPLALALFLAGLGHSNQHGTDGFITRRVALRRLIDFEIEIAPGHTVEADPDFIIGKLLVACCSECGEAMRWCEVEGGYLIHDHNQPTRAEVLEQQKKKADAGRRGGQARAKNRAEAHVKHASSTRQADASDVLEGDDEANGKPVPSRPPVPLANASGSPGGDRDNPPTLTVIDGGATKPRELEPATAQTPAPAAKPVTAQTLLAEYLDTLRERPPSDEVGQLARRLKRLVNDGIDPAHIRAGLADYRARDLHPSVLPSLVAVRQRGGQPRASPGKADRQLNETLNTAADMLRNGPPKGGIADDLGGLDADRGQAQRALAGSADQRRHGGRVVDGSSSLLGG